MVLIFHLEYSLVPNIVATEVDRNAARSSVPLTKADVLQGEAIVRNNLIMNGALVAFWSSDHQGTTSDLTVVHNTIVNNGRAGADRGPGTDIRPRHGR